MNNGSWSSKYAQGPSTIKEYSFIKNNKRFFQQAQSKGTYIGMVRKVLMMIKVDLGPNNSCIMLSASFHSFDLEYSSLAKSLKRTGYMYVNFMHAVKSAAMTVAFI